MFILRCATGALSVDTPVLCTVALGLTGASGSAVTGPNSVVATTVASASTVVMKDVASGQANVVTLISGFGSFTVSTTAPIPNLVVSVSSWTSGGYTILASTTPATPAIPPALLDITSGAVTSIGGMTYSPTSLTAGAQVELTFLALDQYGNKASVATGPLAIVTVNPSTGVTFSQAGSTYPYALTFLEGSASLYITNTVATTLTIGLVPNVTNIVVNSTWTMTYSPASATRVWLTVSTNAMTVGSSLSAVLGLYDSFGNLVTTISSWNMTMSLSDGTSQQFISGNVTNGVLRSNIFWPRAGTVNITTLDLERRGFSSLSTVLIAASSASSDYTLLIILASCVGLSVMLLVLVLFLRRYYNRRERHLAFQRVESILAIHNELIKSATDVPDGEAGQSESNDLNRKSKDSIHQLQGAMVARLLFLAKKKHDDDAYAYSSGQPEQDMWRSVASLLGLVAYLTKLARMLYISIGTDLENDDEFDLWEVEVGKHRGSTLSHQDLDDIKTLGHLVIFKWKRKRIEALRRAEELKARIAYLQSTSHGLAVNALLAEQRRQSDLEEGVSASQVEKLLEELQKRQKAAEASLMNSWNERVAQAPIPADKEKLLSQSRQAFAKLDLDSRVARDALRDQLKSAAEARAIKRKDRNSAAVAKLLKSQESEIASLVEQIGQCNKEASDIRAEAERAIDALLTQGPVQATAGQRSSDEELKAKADRLVQQTHVSQSEVSNISKSVIPESLKFLIDKERSDGNLELSIQGRIAVRFREQREAEVRELTRKQEEKTAAMRVAMQAELDRVAVELAKVEAEKKRNAIMKQADAFRSDKIVLQQFRDQLESSRNAVSRVLEEEKEIQDIILEKKLKQRQQRLVESQRAASAQSQKEEILAYLKVEKAKLDQTTDIDDVVASLSRVNDLQASLVELNFTLSN